MGKDIGALTTAFALLAVAGCGNGAVTADALAADATNNELGLATAQIVDKPELTGDDAAFDAENSKFSLNGETVALTNGLSKIGAAPGSASLVTTRYLGRVARGDLTSDGKADLAYLVTRDGAGSGRFYYAVVAISGTNGYRTTNAFLVGDRIKPQSLRINANELHVYFMGREKGEPMTLSPSLESVLVLKVTPGGALEGLMK